MESVFVRCPRQIWRSEDKAPKLRRIKVKTTQFTDWVRWWCPCDMCGGQFHITQQLLHHQLRRRPNYDRSDRSEV